MILEMFAFVIWLQERVFLVYPTFSRARSRVETAPAGYALMLTFCHLTPHGQIVAISPEGIFLGRILRNRSHLDRYQMPGGHPQIRQLEEGRGISDRGFRRLRHQIPYDRTCSKYLRCLPHSSSSPLRAEHPAERNHSVLHDVAPFLVVSASVFCFQPFLPPGPGGRNRPEFEPAQRALIPGAETHLDGASETLMIHRIHPSARAFSLNSCLTPSARRQTITASP